MNATTTKRGVSRAVFVPMAYTIQYRWEGSQTRVVRGFAFEVPGWPEFHCCVRFDRRNPWDTFKDWIVDHYETGMAVNEAKLKAKEDAPEAVRIVLEKFGKEEVHRRMRTAGIEP